MKSGLINAFFILCLGIFIFSLIYGVVAGFTAEILGLVKATTFLQTTGFVCLAYLMYTSKPKLRKLSEEWINFLIIIAFILVLLSAFEVLFVFQYWFTKMAINGTIANLDTISYVSQVGVFSGGSSVNLNIMSKLYVGLFFVFLYFLYTLNNVRQEKLFKRK